MIPSDLDWLLVAAERRRKMVASFPPRPACLRLMRAFLVWEEARAACAWVRTSGRDIKRTDPLPTFVELIARAALADAIAETCDGSPLGLREHTTSQLQGLLNPATHRRVLSTLNQHIDWSEIAPRSPDPTSPQRNHTLFSSPETRKVRIY